MIMFVLSMIICLISAAVEPDHFDGQTINAKYSFFKCLSNDNYDISTNDTCDEPEWRTEPITISFKDIKSFGNMIKLDLTSIDVDSKKLNYESPALSIEMESSTGAGLLSPLTYFTMRPDEGYGAEFKPLEEFENTVFCSLKKETFWTFSRAVSDDLESSITIVLSIRGNEVCSWLEIAMNMLKQYWYLAVAGGVFLLGSCVCVICFCGCNCVCINCLLNCLDCYGCLGCLDCCGCLGETTVTKVLEIV